MSCNGVANPGCGGSNPHMCCFGVTMTGPSADDLQDVLGAAAATTAAGDLQQMTNNRQVMVDGNDLVSFAQSDPEARPLFEQIQQNVDFTNHMPSVAQQQNCKPLDSYAKRRLADIEQQKMYKELDKQHKEMMKVMGCPDTQCKIGRIDKSCRKKKAPAKKKCQCKKTKTKKPIKNLLCRFVERNTMIHYGDGETKYLVPVMADAGNYMKRNRSLLNF